MRSILEWFGAERRGANIIPDIKDAIASLDLGTKPSIDEAKLDDAVRFYLTVTDDYLEHEVDDEHPTGPDDRPVSSHIADWTIQTLRLRVDKGHIILQPRFQRQYVWNLRPELPSRLIESLLLEIPIPPIYFYNDTDNDNDLEVIDGPKNFLSHMLGVRRNTVSVEAHSVQQAGLIQYRRGHITIVDREGLEECACECYSVIRAETDKLMGTA